MFNDQEWAAIARRVLSASEAGQLRWAYLQHPGQLSADLDPTYFARVGNVTEYRIWAKDNDSRFPYRFIVLRASDEGDQFERVDGYDTEPFEEGDGSPSDVISALYEIAARDSANASVVVAELLAELDRLDSTDEF